jgi:hypothetical protein
MFDEGKLAGTPIQASNLVGKGNTLNSLSLDRDLKRVSLSATGDRARQGKPGRSIVFAGAEHQPRPSPRLFVAQLRVKRYPN